MLSKRSIRTNFLIKLIFASASLIFIFSSVLYFYIEKSIYNEKRQELLTYAKNIANNRSITNMDVVPPDIYLGLDIEVLYLKKNTR